MGLLDEQKEDKDKKNDSKIMKTLKKQITAALVGTGIKIIPLILVIAIITSVIEWVIKTFQAKNTVDKIYENLKMDDVCDLIQIKGNDKDGYYLDFADDIDDKLDDTIEYLDSTAGVKSGIDKKFLKKMIKAEVCTQFPDLGAKVDDKGFQGIIDILRIMPNKEFNSLKNTGAGQETVKDEDELNNTEINNKDVINRQEKEVKGWEKGKELTLTATAFVYSQEDSKLHSGEKIDYWTPQKSEKTQNNLKLQKNTTVTYTGEYSISIDKMTNEGLIYVGIEKDDIKGYIKYNFISKDSGEDESNTAEDLADSGYSEITKEKVIDTIDSNVYKLTYIPKEKFDEYMANSNKDVLYNFTIDDDGNLITATWSVGEDGSFDLQNNSAINLKSALQNYIIPYAYLMYFYIEADYKGFSNDLADKVLDSKIIIALEDNVTTTNIKETIEEKKVSESSSFSYDWKAIDKKETTTEYCNTNIEIIYADTWCVKLVNKDIFKTDLLSVSVGQAKNIKMPGTVTDTTSNSISEEKSAGEGTDTKEETNLKFDENGKPKFETVTHTYSYKMYQRTITDTHSISNSYASGNKEIKSNENVFVNLYKEHQMDNRMNDRRFLQILENDERTANLVNLTKYLMYMATYIDYGVKEYDFISIYKDNTFNDVCGNGQSNLGDIQGQIADFFLSKGMSLEGVAALLGNIEQESGFDSSIESKTKNFIGLCQWGRYYNGKQSRGIELENYALKEGTKWTDANTQIKFIWKELNSSGYASVKNELMNATDASKAAEYFARYYEKCINADGSLQGIDNRKKFAEKWLKELKNKATSGDIDTSSFLATAKSCHDYLRQNNYWYPSSANLAAGRFVSDGKSEKHKFPTIGESPSTRYIDCSAYVSWVLKEYGYKLSSPYSASGLLANPLNLKEVPISSVKAGDILVKSSHTEIYCGNGRSYNCGSTNAIRSETSGCSPSSFTKAFRVNK